MKPTDYKVSITFFDKINTLITVNEGDIIKVTWSGDDYAYHNPRFTRTVTGTVIEVDGDGYLWIKVQKSTGNHLEYWEVGDINCVAWHEIQEITRGVMQ